MNQQFDCDQLFAEFNAPSPYFSDSNAKNTNTAIFSDELIVTGEIIEEAFGNEFFFDFQEPKQANHVWSDAKEDVFEEKIQVIARKDTADSEQLCREEYQASIQSGKRIQDQQKNETKNIPKNFGKAILAFTIKHKKIAKSVLQKYNSCSYKDLIEYLTKNKKEITTIADLRSLWVDNKYEQVLRTLSCVFLRKYSLQYIFNSRICNYGSHIKYRQRFLEAIKCPKDFQHIKEY